MFSQLLQVRVAHRGCSPRNLVGKMNDCCIFFVEELAVVVKGEGMNLFVSDSNPLRRSGMRLGSILAGVHDRGFEIGEFLVSVIECARTGSG